jgi:hypothetical protein
MTERLVLHILENVRPDAERAGVQRCVFSFLNSKKKQAAVAPLLKSHAACDSAEAQDQIMGQSEFHQLWRTVLSLKAAAAAKDASASNSVGKQKQIPQEAIQGGEMRAEHGVAGEKRTAPVEHEEGGRAAKKKQKKVGSARYIICPHKRRRSQCKECGGTSICPHQRRRNDCKECGGTSICSHQRKRHECKDCGGTSICPHQRLRSRCKECGGSSICPHQRIRSACKECGGTSICPHQRQRNRCKECGGSGICPHQRQRSLCKDCGGTSICPHQRKRSRCKECGGASICPHQRIRSQCKECGGASICPHQRRRSGCKECRLEAGEGIDALLSVMLGSHESKS